MEPDAQVPAAVQPEEDGNSIVLLVAVPFLSFIGVLLSNKKKGSGVQSSREVAVQPFHSVRVSEAGRVTCHGSLSVVHRHIHGAGAVEVVE